MTHTFVRVTIDHDLDVDSPCDRDEEFRFVSFNRYVIGSEPIDNYIRGFTAEGEAIPANPGLASKLRAGTAFWISLYDHSSRTWTLKGEGYHDRWDSTVYAGILLWDHDPNDIGRTYEEREKAARTFIEEYTDWAEGNTYYYKIEKIVADHGFDPEMDDVDDLEGVEEIDSCGGFIGEDWLTQNIREAIKDNGLEDAELIVEGDASWIADYHDLMPSKSA